MTSFMIQLFTSILIIPYSNADQSCTSTPTPKSSPTPICQIDQITPWQAPPTPSPTGNFVCDNNYWECVVNCDANDLSSYGACSGFLIPAASNIHGNVEIHCPTGGPAACSTCTINCLSTHSCSGVTIYGYDCSNVVINLDTEQTLIKIHAGQSRLFVNTLSNAVTSRNYIYGNGANTPLQMTVNCTNGLECVDYSIRGDNVGNGLHFICGGDVNCGPGISGGTEIYCPNDVNGVVTDECIIDCISRYGSGAGTTSGGCKQMQIYAIEGLYDVDWTCNTYGLSNTPSYTDYNCYLAELHCGASYENMATWTHPTQPFCCFWALSGECNYSPSPTPAPTGVTGTPTFSPTEDPTMTPTRSPSATPSSAPTLPPTQTPISVCTDYDENSNDGTNELIFDMDLITDLNNYEAIAYGVFTEFTTSTLIDYMDQSIDCGSMDCMVQCIEKASCLDTRFLIGNSADETTVIYCQASYSCATSSILWGHPSSSDVIKPNVTVICVDKNACNGMYISVKDFTSFNLYCIESLSCNHINLTIEVNAFNTGYTKDNEGIISCVKPNSCDDLYIATNSNQTQLIMYEYSDNVILNNGVGYLYDDENIICNNDRYIRIETSQTITTQNLTNLIYHEYTDHLLPCQGVGVYCGDYSCSMQYIQRTLTGITPNTGCLWLNVMEIQNIVCEGGCIGSPTSPPTATPTDVPTTPTSDPSSSPTIAPSKAPIAPPTTSPSVSPTMKPTTAEPSVSPSNAPTTKPTVSPTGSPTQNPSQKPSFAPTTKPSPNPTESPTVAPTTSPSQSPTRVPTKNIADIYGSFIDIIYIITNLKDEYIELLEDETLDIIPYILEIIESNYFVGEDVVEYKDFHIKINAINSFYDLSNINLKSGENVEIDAKILSDSDVAGILLKTSEKDVFADDVTVELKGYFTNNTNLAFYVENKESLRIGTETESEEEESWEIIIISAFIVGIGAILSCFVKINNYIGSKVDDAKWKAPLLFSLQVYDFISDINLVWVILNDPAAYQDGSKANIIFWCGIFSGAFTALPFISNLMYGIAIKKQRVIRENKRADEYFTANMAIFIGLIVISGGCYPALIMVSSGIFALNAFQSGLTKHELSRLSKIKIKSTITLENGPQLIVQIIYVTQTTNVGVAVFLAFVGSLLSIIMAVASFMANRESRKDSDIMSYYLRFHNGGKKEIDCNEKNNINKNKGRTSRLTRELSSSLGVSRDNLEIGYVWTLSNGVEMHISHYLPKSELAKHTRNVNGYKSEITPQQYLVERYKNTKYKQSINEKFRNHFKINNKNFIVQFVMDNMVTMDTIQTMEYNEGRNAQQLSDGNRSPQIVEMHNMMQAMMKHMNINTVINNTNNINNNNDTLEIEDDETKQQEYVL